MAPIVESHSTKSRLSPNREVLLSSAKLAQAMIELTLNPSPETYFNNDKINIASQKSLSLKNKEVDTCEK
jgi:hypothetical protein